MSICGELLGLPGVGKSYVLSNNANFGDKSVSKIVINRGCNLKKVINVFYGLVLIKFSTLIDLLKLVSLKKGFLQIKLVFVLIERIGRKKRMITDSVIDEGVLQALWGLLWRINEYDYSTVISILMKLKFEINIVYYIRCGKKENQKRLMNRKTDNPDIGYRFFSNEESQKNGRNAMACLLKAIRQLDLTIIFIDSSLHLVK